jgi:hypothetical protein
MAFAVHFNSVLPPAAAALSGTNAGYCADAQYPGFMADSIFQFKNDSEAKHDLTKQDGLRMPLDRLG